MNLEKILNYLFTNPDSVRTISYSNIDGEESLKINGEEMLDKYDDSELLSQIAKCKEILDCLDDCTFEDVVNDLKEDENIKELNDIFEKEHFTEDEHELVEEKLDKIRESIFYIVEKKIDRLNKILEQL